MICPTINIIAVSYHRPNDFKLCIQSIVENTDLPYKLTIIDNSTGKLDNQLNQFAKHATIIRNDINIGKGKSFKKYYKSICSDDGYFISLDADVIVPERWLSKMMSVVMQIEQPFAALAPVLLRDNQDSFDNQVKCSDIYMHGGNDGFHDIRRISDNLYSTKLVAGPLLLLSCQFYNKIGGYPGDVLYGHDDGFICNKAVQMNHFIGITDIISCIHSNIDSDDQYAQWKINNLNNKATKSGRWC